MHAKRLASPAVRAPEPPPVALLASAVTFTTPRATVASAPDVASIDIPGLVGTFSVPYIQAGPDLPYALGVTAAPKGALVEVWLDQGLEASQRQVLRGPPWSGTFRGVAYGEHTLDARLFAPQDMLAEPLALSHPALAGTRLTRVARGDVVAALGDSTTEGLGGAPLPPGVAAALHFFPDWTAAEAALDPVDPSLVTADGRNYPQAGGSSHTAPSFTVDLARTLAEQRGHPVLVLNDGWSGVTADGYVGISTSELLKRQSTVIRPGQWLVNLGVNDALVRRPPAEFRQRMQTLVENLEHLHGAQPDQIHIACPSYALQPARHELEQAYLPVIDQLRTAMDLAPAPDLFGSYRDHPTWIQDAVHPSAEGYTAMAQLWADALGGRGSACGA